MRLLFIFFLFLSISVYAEPRGGAGNSNGEEINGNVEVIESTNPQLTLTHTPSVNETTLYTDSNGELNISPTGNSVIFPSGTQSNPAVAIGPSGDMGFFESGANILGTVVPGTPDKRTFMSVSGFSWGNDTGNSKVVFEQSTIQNPTYVFRTDENTGVGWSSSSGDGVSLVGGGIETLKGSSSSGNGLVSINRPIQVTLVTPGTGYTVDGTLIFSGGGGTGATGVYEVTGSDTIGTVTITDYGTGYTSNPTVTTSDPGNGDAVITAVLYSTQLLVASENDAVTPTLGFGNGNSGWYESFDDNLVCATATVPRIQIEPDGTLSSLTSNYETLVTADDDIPNKKYVDDSFGVTQAFAEIYVHDNGTSQSIASGASYTKSTVWDTNGLSNNVTADQANDKITFTQTGIYKVSLSASGRSGTANVNLLGSIFVNVTEQNQCHFRRKISTANDEGSMSITCFVDITATPWDLDYRMRHDNISAVDITITYANMNVLYIGPT